MCLILKSCNKTRYTYHSSSGNECEISLKLVANMVYLNLRLINDMQFIRSVIIYAKTIRRQVSIFLKSQKKTTSRLFDFFFGRSFKNNKKGVSFLKNDMSSIVHLDCGKKGCRLVTLFIFNLFMYFLGLKGTNQLKRPLDPVSLVRNQ